MSEKIVPFRGGSGGRGGSGPDDPDLLARVSRLEDGNARIEAALARVEASQHRSEIDTAELKGRIIGIEGRFAAMPTSLQLISVVVALVVAAGLFRFFEPRYAPGAAPQPQQGGLGHDPG